MLDHLKSVTATFGRLLYQQKSRTPLVMTKEKTVAPIDPIATVLRRSHLFDKVWYSKRYGVEADRALDHYIQVGDRLLYNPNPIFDTGFYRGADEGLDRENMNSLLHYIRHGHPEGRKVNDYVDHTPSEAHWIRGVNRS